MTQYILIALNGQARSQKLVSLIDHAITSQGEAPAATVTALGGKVDTQRIPGNSLHIVAVALQPGFGTCTAAVGLGIEDDALIVG